MSLYLVADIGINTMAASTSRSVTAVTLGATSLERHILLDREMYARTRRLRLRLPSQGVRGHGPPNFVHSGRWHADDFSS